MAQFEADFLFSELAYLTAQPLLAVLPAAFKQPPIAAQWLLQAYPIRGPDAPMRPAGRALLTLHQTFLL